ncbi:MAG TPA: LuxR C-terminal-related transcriptional regulator [Bradyrhizobium sp.]|jgi:DNA-binding CsgD family transcriptional regulator|nr:LuxR C-terminal-related transcriptional regulator [Bradyrhizobium sp.]
MSPESGNAATPTPRERELMMLIARGMQNKNIAHELSISENTVRAHIGNIMRKYHLQNRTQIAIIFALETATPTLRRAMLNSQYCSEPVLEPRPTRARNSHVRTVSE